MRSFAISAFTFLAFGIFCSAAPTPNDLSVVNVSPTFKDNLNIGGRDDTATEHNSLEYILTGVASDVCSKSDRLNNFKSEDATVDVLKPLLEEVKEILVGAIEAVKCLVDFPEEKILHSDHGSGLLDVKGVAKLLASVLRAVFTLLKCVLGLVTHAVKGEILHLVIEIVKLLAELVSCVLGLVGHILEGLIKAVVELIHDLVPFILSLGVAVIIDVLCLLQL